MADSPASPTSAPPWPFARPTPRRRRRRRRKKTWRRTWRSPHAPRARAGRAAAFSSVLTRAANPQAAQIPASPPPARRPSTAPGFLAQDTGSLAPHPRPPPCSPRSWLDSLRIHRKVTLHFHDASLSRHIFPPHGSFILVVMQLLRVPAEFKVKREGRLKRVPDVLRRGVERVCEAGASASRDTGVLQWCGWMRGRTERRTTCLRTEASATAGST